MRIIFSQNMEFRLSKDVPTMSQTFLEQILGSDVVWSKIAKIVIWPFLGTIHSANSTEHKFRTKRRRNILRPDFESLGSTLSISNLIFIFQCLFVTQTVSSVRNGIFGRRNR